MVKRAIFNLIGGTAPMRFRGAMLEGIAKVIQLFQPKPEDKEFKKKVKFAKKCNHQFDKSSANNLLSMVDRIYCSYCEAGITSSTLERLAQSDREKLVSTQVQFILCNRNGEPVARTWLAKLKGQPEIVESRPFTSF